MHIPNTSYLLRLLKLVDDPSHPPPLQVGDGWMGSLFHHLCERHPATGSDLRLSAPERLLCQHPRYLLPGSQANHGAGLWRSRLSYSLGSFWMVKGRASWFTDSHALENDLSPQRDLDGQSMLPCKKKKIIISVVENEVPLLKTMKSLIHMYVYRQRIFIIIIHYCHAKLTRMTDIMVSMTWRCYTLPTSFFSIDLEWWFTDWRRQILMFFYLLKGFSIEY